MNLVVIVQIFNLNRQQYTMMKQNSQYNTQHQQTHSQLLKLFPKQPYSIQLDLANLLLKALQEQHIKLAIIQSPTGTGKTYSLLVPLIAWLNNNPTALKTEAERKSTLPSWLKKPSQQKAEMMLNQKNRTIEKAINITEAQNELKKTRMKHAASNALTPTKGKEEQEIEIESQQQEKDRGNMKRAFQQKMELMVQKQLKINDQTVLPKIIFVSRTHTQLSQVIDSLKLINASNPSLKYIEIASKEHLCINPAINTNKMNVSERCQYILDHSKCDFFHNLTIKDFFDTNIEDAGKLGTAHHLCPYYATRNLIQECDILCLPYVSILSSDIRDRIGININNSIIVFDEGHNVIDNEKQLHSPEISIADVALLAQQVDQYLKKYSQRMKISNERLMMHFLEILRAFVSAIEKYRSANCKEIEEKKYLKVQYYEFVGQLALKELKIHKILKYVQLNNIDQKLAYFNANSKPNSTAEKSLMKNKRAEEGKTIITTTKINNILRFFLQFSTLNEEKQVLLLKWTENKQGSIKILCLESEELQRIIEKSRMTIIAGGTMEPLDDFNPLLEKLKDKVLIRKFPHIIQKDQCKVMIVKKYKKREIIFNHQTTNDQKNMGELRQMCLKVVIKIMERTEKGGGIVIFIQNYRLISFFKETFKGQPFFSRMLFDGKEQQEDLPNKDIFSSYKDLVQKDQVNSHILVSVMGGKLSEGINFSDRLARSLIVFGLPYANIYAPEVVETVNYLQGKKKSNKKQFLQSLCMRTLNQTIGRGVRHVKDYVSIYLVDSRFEGVKGKFSEWMKDRVNIVNDMEDL